MKKMILLATLLLAGVSAQAQEKTKILDCMETIFLNDPNFQQGSERFFDVFATEGKLEVFYTSGDLRKETILTAASNTTANVDLEDGSLHGSWKSTSKVDLVLRDFGTRWRGVFMFPEGYQSETLTVAPGAEIELSCVLKL